MPGACAEFGHLVTPGTGRVHQRVAVPAAAVFGPDLPAGGPSGGGDEAGAGDNLAAAAAKGRPVVGVQRAHVDVAGVRVVAARGDVAGSQYRAELQRLL